MSIIAYGAEKVKALQHALGGNQPEKALREPRMHLDHFVAERFKALQAEREKTARLSALTRDRLFSQIPKDDPGLRQTLAETRKYCENRLKREIHMPKATKIEPQVITGSTIWIKVPPYDNPWQFASNGSVQAGADNVAGNYNIALQSIGNGSLEGAAGLGVWFFATATDPNQRVAAVIDYADDWWDMASGYVAHNDLRTRLWVWGNTEQAWVGQSDQQPSWSDGVGWFESHGNDPAGDEGRISIQTSFMAQANNWYQAWIWADASVYADDGFWGFAASSLRVNTSVPMVVFGGLF